MSRSAELIQDIANGDSVFTEITRNFQNTLKASKLVLGDTHLLTTACLHASVFPTDRMSLKMVWEQFQALPVGYRAEMLQVLRSRML